MLFAQQFYSWGCLYGNSTAVFKIYDVWKWNEIQFAGTWNVSQWLLSHYGNHTGDRAKRRSAHSGYSKSDATWNIILKLSTLELSGVFKREGKFVPLDVEEVLRFL